jgi:hypothetical protein
VAYDEPVADPAREAIRKRRTIAGNAQLVRLFPAWLLALAQSNLVSVRFPQIAAAGFAVPVAGRARGALPVIGQSVLCACAARNCFLRRGRHGICLPARRPARRMGGVPLMFTALNLTRWPRCWMRCAVVST